MTDMIYFTSRNNSQIPRIVAAKLKTQFKNKVGFNDCGIKPRISGDLRIVDRSFRHLRYAEVRDGCLILYRYVGNNKVWDFHIPLYNLNINLDSPQYYCQFSLSKFGEIAPIATFQVVKEQTYKKWLKTLAVEVIRQTPLNTLKFMDILFIGELLERHQSDRVKPRSKSRSNLSPCESGRDGRTPRTTIYSGNDINSLNETCSTSTDPLTNSSHGFIDTPRNDSLHCDSLDKHNHSNYCVDSGYCSWQSQSAPKSDISESETGSIKPFEQLCQKFQVQPANESNLPTPRPKLDPRQKSATLDCTWSLKNSITDKENHLPDINTSCYTNKQLPQWMKKPKQDGFGSRSQTPEPGSPIFPNPYVTRFFNENNIKRSYRGSFDMAMEPSSLSWEVNGSRDAIPDVLRDLPDTLPRTKRKSSVSLKFNEELMKTENANLLVKLLTKCQIDKEYVPVREKRLLFESLSRFSFSVDNLKKRILADRPDEEKFVKFRSLLDLNGSPVPVSAMRRYFESFNEKDEK